MNDKNILEIYQMIETLEDFFNNSSSRNIVVGGMIGSHLFKHAIEAALTVHSFDKILVVEGCQDYIGLQKTPIPNHVYYADLFVDVLCDPITPYDPFKPKIFNPSPTYHKQLNLHRIEQYDVILMKESHLIPAGYIDAIVKNYSGKICILVDPYDIGGEMFYGIPTLTDSMNKLSPIVGMARSIYNVDTRAIDRSIKGHVTEARINKRSIGKIDDKQYVTNDEYLADIVRHKQLQSPFRRNQKLFVTSDKINTSIDDEHGNSLTRNSMCVIMSASSRPLMKLRIYSSKIMYAGDVSYLDNPPEHSIRVKPANILTINESAFHRYNHMVMVCTEPLTQRQRYSILKNSNNVTICQYSGK